MFIEKLTIKNYKGFHGEFSLLLNSGINLIVGDNETGKSTILEAINIALTGVLNGRYLKNEINQYLFNNEVVNRFIAGVSNGDNPELPIIQIELFFKKGSNPLFDGNGNSEGVNACGLSFKIEFDQEYKKEYEELINSSEPITTIPIEYYRVVWRSFAREPITSRSIPLKSAFIDSTANKFQNGSDIYISRIIQDDLDSNEKVLLSQTYRKMKESFVESLSVKSINSKISNKTKITNKKFHVSVDLSAKNSWETNLMIYLDDVPFHQVGKGEQCIIKTNLALSHHKAKEANIVLIEEPENHLSHTKLNELIKNVIESCSDKQIIISTHSNFVANKLGLDNLILINNKETFRLNCLSEGTFNFFKKLPGYQTLRILLCRKAILVEGDSDELIFQRAYMDKNGGRLPIEDGIDVISVKLTFKRFLEIAEKIHQPIAVITDNDRDYHNNITKKYVDYKDSSCVKIFSDPRNELNTLEPQFVDSNKENLKDLCKAIKIRILDYKKIEDISDYMIKNKTEWALNVFESELKLNYPDYILRALEWCDE